MLGDALDGEEPFDAIHVGAGARMFTGSSSSSDGGGARAAVQAALAGGAWRCRQSDVCPPLWRAVRACARPIAAASKLPDVLVKKLAPGGRMVIPVGLQWDYQVRLQ